MRSAAIMPDDVRISTDIASWVSAIKKVLHSGVVGAVDVRVEVIGEMGISPAFIAWELVKNPDVSSTFLLFTLASSGSIHQIRVSAI